MDTKKELTALCGDWIRQGDSFKGCIIRLEFSDWEFIGKLLYASEEMMRCGWKAGDLKWRRILPRGNRRFVLMDLSKSFAVEKKRVVDLKYVESRLILKTPHQLILRSRGWFSPKQKWHRLTSGPLEKLPGSDL